MASSGSASKAWGVAVSIGAVEALKDQLGFCRWNHVFRSAQQYAGRNYKHSSSTPAPANNFHERLGRVGKKRANETEDPLRTVLYLSCWGPYN
ncbi:hypothetical protein LINGRAHAP2_LOCUS18789 [Linum grandiflorum]